MVELQIDPNFFKPPIPPSGQAGKPTHHHPTPPPHPGVLIIHVLPSLYVLTGVVEGVDLHEVDPSTGLPKHSLAIRAFSAAHMLCAYSDTLQPTDLLSVDGDKRAQALLAWRLMHAINAHLLSRIFQPQPDQRPACERAIAIASEHILAKHVHDSLTRLLGWVDAEGADGLLLPPCDARAALNMAAWVQGRIARLEEKVPTHAAQATWAKLAGRVTAVW